MQNAYLVYRPILQPGLSEHGNDVNAWICLQDTGDKELHQNKTFLSITLPSPGEL